MRLRELSALSTWPSAVGILSTLIGARYVAYEVVNKFRGTSHTVSTSWGGQGSATKTEAFIQWEAKRNFFMWIGLGFITAGSLLQLAGLLC